MARIPRSGPPKLPWTFAEQPTAPAAAPPVPDAPPPETERSTSRPPASAPLTAGSKPREVGLDELLQELEQKPELRGTLKLRESVQPSTSSLRASAPFAVARSAGTSHPKIEQSTSFPLPPGPAKDAPAPLVLSTLTLGPGTEVDRYVIERALGSGGMAHVFLVRHAYLGTRHALKVLAADAAQVAEIRQRFLAEGQIQASLKHPNIVPVTDIVAVPGLVGLVMDFMDGESLDDVIARMPAPPRPQLVRAVFQPVLAGVGHAHGMGIVHRDLKPSNVMIARRADESLDVRILDFGIAKVARGDAAVRGTRTGAIMGTPNYMSPEQIQGAKNVTPRSDVFSLGATLYEFATGKLAFDGESDFEIQLRITQGRYVPPAERYPRIDAQVAFVIEKAMQVDPARRFASCADMARALGN